LEIEKAVYPWLGPGRTAGDVEQARAALEKAYRDKGYQTVSVEIPPQQGRGGIVFLSVVEQKVGRLRVTGARFFLPSQIKAKAPSMAEGTVLNFNDVSRDIVALNKWPDRRVVPSVAAGQEPGTADVNLGVKDSLPLHGSLELNNRYSAYTTPLRLNAALSYNNLWQLGHSAGFNYEVAPERTADATIYSGFYTARIPNVNWLTLTLEARKQDSSIAPADQTFFTVAPGETLGGHLSVTLPSIENFFHSLSFGASYKHYQSDTGIAFYFTENKYYLWNLDYEASWVEKGSITALDLGLNYSLRGTSSAAAFEQSRYKADDGFIYLRGHLSHTHDLPAGFEVFGKVQGQISDRPLINSEQFAGGGLDSARGYLEATQLGDSALFGTVELRSPSLLFGLGGDRHEWRVYGFCDAGILTLRDPLPDEQSRFNFASVGVGTRVRLLDHFNGSLDAGFPLTQPASTSTNHLLLTFRLWSDF
jgi:hemolysin activation/secretion protein